MQQNFNNNYHYNEIPQYQNANGQYYMPNPMVQNMADPQQFYINEAKSREKKELIITGIVIGATIICYILVQVLASSILLLPSLAEAYKSSALFQNCFNIIGVHLLSMALPFGIMSLILKKRYTGPLVPSEKVGFVKGTAWVCFGMGCCMIANVVTALVIQIFKAFGYELKQAELAKPDSIFACIALVLSTAIVPAVVEEFAMRCCTLGALRKYGKGFAVFAVSIVFGLLHLNVIQFVFAFIVGMVLGLVTIKTNSILPAVLIHGFNNGLSVIQDIINYATKAKISEHVLSVLYIIWVVLAIFAFVYLIIKKEIFAKKQTDIAQGCQSLLSTKTKLLCLLPGFIVPLIILVGFSMTTIVPIGS